jgi:hypothetical protein
VNVRPSAAAQPGSDDTVVVLDVVEHGLRHHLSVVHQ